MVLFAAMFVTAFADALVAVFEHLVLMQLLRLSSVTKIKCILLARKYFLFESKNKKLRSTEEK